MSEHTDEKYRDHFAELTNADDGSRILLHPDVVVHVAANTMSDEVNSNVTLRGECQSLVRGVTGRTLILADDVDTVIERLEGAWRAAASIT